jgi:DNA repair exonuclease SbcCD ATPase subunit
LGNFDGKPEVPKEVEKPGTNKDELVAKASQYRHALQHARKFKTGVCGECGQEVKSADPELTKKRLDTVLTAIGEWEDYEASVIKCKEALASYAIWMAAKKDAKAHKANAETYDRRRGLKKPARVVKPLVEGDVKKLRADLATLDFCQPHLDTIVNLAKLSPEDRTMKFDSTALDELTDKQSALKVKLEVHRSVKERARELKERMEELRELTTNEKALELLVSAYAEKAVKKMAIEAISQRLMAQVNKYAPLVFHDYHFDFVWDSQISIRVHRPGADEPTDVRKLSGAESKLFTLIFVLAQLMFVPKNKRLSLLILDEPMASFSEETSELFQKLLPHILQLIPSILVVTPDARERLEGANEFTVLRTLRGSRIVKGHPNEI